MTIKPLNLTLYIAADGEWGGPMELRMFADHEPRMILQAHVALGFPASANRVYCLRSGTLLTLDTSFDAQGIVEADVLLATDSDDLWLLKALSEAFGVTTPPTSIEEFKGRLSVALREALEATPYAGKALAALIYGRRAP